MSISQLSEAEIIQFQADLETIGLTAEIDSRVYGVAVATIFHVKRKVDRDLEGDFSKASVVVVDPQNDFVDGSLGGLTEEAVQERKDALIVSSLVARYMKSKGAHIIATRDWHPEGHRSFASSFEGAEPFKEYILEPNNSPNKNVPDKQMLWPDHCVQDTFGAEFHSSFDGPVDVVVSKGMEQRESYSGCSNVDGKKNSNLDDLLQKKKIEAVFTTGLCADFCVPHTAKDLAVLGYDVVILEDATAAVFPQGKANCREAVQELVTQKMWRKNINSKELSDPSIEGMRLKKDEKPKLAVFLP